MRLERHVGGLGKARGANYLRSRGWQEAADGWSSVRRDAQAQRFSRALHHQLTEDLCLALAPRGWSVVDYSDRGYVRLKDAATGTLCSLPKALRMQAKREQQKVADFTYALFLAAVVTEGS